MDKIRKGGSQAVKGLGLMSEKLKIILTPTPASAYTYSEGREY